jgi:hypothetical protein
VVLVVYRGPFQGLRVELRVALEWEVLRGLAAWEPTQIVEVE